MDSSPNKQSKNAHHRAEAKSKLPNIHKSVKHRTSHISQPGPASTSSSEDWTHETLLPQIEKSNNFSNGAALDITSTNNNAKTNPSAHRPTSPGTRPRTRPTSNKSTPRASMLLHDSLREVKKLGSKKRKTMTLLSPTLSGIEDAITRHGPYEGEIPVMRPDLETPDEETASHAKISLRSVMSAIDQVSYKEVGFDPDQLIRTDPTVAKAVCEILKEHTHEDDKCLTRITLALCDDRLNNNQVLRVLEDNVKGRTEENIAVYFAMAFFISKTKDPTRIQISNSALTTDASPSESKTQLRSDKSVGFLANALDKFMILSQRVASLISNDQASDQSSLERRPTFVEMAEATPRKSMGGATPRKSMGGSRKQTKGSFDFQTPSGWFFEEVEIDHEIVEIIRQSVPAMISFVINERLSLPEEGEVSSEEDGTILIEKDSKESPRRKTLTGFMSRLVSPDKGFKKSPTASFAKAAVWTPKKTPPGRVLSKQRKDIREKEFQGWDMTTDLAPHWLTRLPKETDLIIPMLQRIRRCQRKDVNQIPARQKGRRSTEDNTARSSARLGSSGSTVIKAQVEHDLKIEAFKGQLTQQALDRAISGELPEPSMTSHKLSGIQPGPTQAPPGARHAGPEESVQEYLSRNKVFELFADLIANLVLTTPEDPLDTLIDRVHQINLFKGIKNEVSNITRLERNP